MGELIIWLNDAVMLRRRCCWAPPPHGQGSTMTPSTWCSPTSAHLGPYSSRMASATLIGASGDTATRLSVIAPLDGAQEFDKVVPRRQRHRFVHRRLRPRRWQGPSLLGRALGPPKMGRSAFEARLARPTVPHNSVVRP